MWKKIAANGSRVAVIETINHYFDLLYVPAIIWLGAVWGGVVMTVAAIALNYVFIRVYNGSTGDWYGFEWMRGKLRSAWWGKAAMVPFILVASWWDPFAAFIFIRGKQDVRYRFTLLDWALLAVITIFASFVWTGMLWSGLELLKRLWHLVF